MSKVDMAARRLKGRENRAELIAQGWPEDAHDTKECSLRWITIRPYGRAQVVFKKGFHAHWEGDNRVAFGRNYDTVLKALIRILEPDVERIELGDAAPATREKVARPRRAVENLQQITATLGLLRRAALLSEAASA